jgi:S-adenosylmethionine:tRNA ribosyltransferase-isomerase
MGMKTSDFFFEIDPDKIAQYPPKVRGTSRLLILNREKETLEDSNFSHFPEKISPGSLVVINDSRVRKARVFGTSTVSGKATEFLFLEQVKPGLWKVLVNRMKKQKPGKTFRFTSTLTGTITGHEGGCCILALDRPVGEEFFEQYGHVPLPPYIKRADTDTDSQRYQTVYSRYIGSAAAPTAGLHLTDVILDRLREKGCRVVRITLHVGMGTFIPIRTENIEDHHMHEEEYSISKGAADIIEQYLHTDRKITAVGTTVVRALESAYHAGRIRSGKHTTSLFIYPGFRFNVINGLLTNFHTPGSSLLVLVSAFTGKEYINRAYNHALKNGYTFFSYGDAMLIR